MADSKKNYYEILGVSKTATDDEIKAAYRKKVKEYHPDLHPDDKDAAEKFKEINEANETLSDKQKRAAYDYSLEHPEAANAGGGSYSGQGFSGFSGFDDIFSSFFGGGQSGGSASAEDRAGEDISVTVTLSFMDAAKGCSREVSYFRNKPCAACQGTGAKEGTAYSTCPKCNGQGRIRYSQETMFGRSVRISDCPDCGGTGKKIIDRCPVCGGRRYMRENEKISVNIPAGADNDSYILKRGMGQASPTGGPSGDLYVKFRVEPSKIFQRKGLDLYVDLPIPFATATLGGTVRIPDLNDSIAYRVPEGTQNGTVFTVRGKGISSRQGTGNLYARVFVEIPTKLTREQKKKIEEAANSVRDPKDPLKAYPKSKRYDDSLGASYGKKAYEE